MSRLQKRHGFFVHHGTHFGRTADEQGLRKVKEFVSWQAGQATGGFVCPLIGGARFLQLCLLHNAIWPG